MNELLLTMVIQYVIYKNLSITGYPAAISSPTGTLRLPKFL